MAHKKGVGSSRNGRDSNPKYRGVKKFGGERVIPGNIIIRQCGTKWHPGTNVGMGNDYTIFALIEGVVKFEHKSKSRFKVSVYPTVAPTLALRADCSSKRPTGMRGRATSRPMSCCRSRMKTGSAMTSGRLRVTISKPA